MADVNKVELDGPPPQWDEALEGLLQDEYRKKGAGLNMDDTVRLAQDHAIRLDDLMVTLFELVLQSKWRYVAANGAPQAITREEVNRLYIDRRMREEDLRGYTGHWNPV